MRNILALVLILWAGITSPLHAALPSFEASCGSDINYVNGVEIAVSLDCGTIFVFPPASGEIHVSAINRPTNEEVCNQFNSHNRAVSALARTAETLANELDEAVKAQDPDAGQKLELMREFSAAVVEATEITVPYYNDYGARVNLALRMDWQSHIERVADENPNKAVVPVPIVSADLVYISKVKIGKRYNNLLSVSVPGLANRVNSFKSNKASTDNNVQPNENFSTVPMGSELIGTVVFSLPGVCQDDTLDGSAFTGNLFYTVPFQTRSYVKIKMDVDFLAKKVADRIAEANGGEITLNQLAENLSVTNNAGDAGGSSFSVTASAGIPLPESGEFSLAEMKKEYETAALLSLSTSILNSLGKIISADPELPKIMIDGEVVENRSKVVCSRKLFRKKCSNVTYKVTLPRTEIERVVKRVTAEINFSQQAEFAVLNTFLTTRTAGFNPVAEE